MISLTPACIPEQLRQQVKSKLIGASWLADATGTGEMTYLGRTCSSKERGNHTHYTNTSPTDINGEFHWMHTAKVLNAWPGESYWMHDGSQFSFNTCTVVPPSKSQYQRDHSLIMTWASHHRHSGIGDLHRTTLSVCQSEQSWPY